MEVLRTAILDMLRRKKDSVFCTSEVVQQMYPEDWEQFLLDVNREAMKLHREGQLIVCEVEKYADTDLSIEAALKISKLN